MLTSPTDFLRNIVKNKLQIYNHIAEFNEIYAKIKTYYVEEDM